jgi:hypothetical protein
MTKPTLDDLSDPLLDLKLVEAKEDLQRLIENLAEKVVYKMLEDSFHPTLQQMINDRLKLDDAKPENQRERDARWYWIMWHGLCKLWYWVDKRKPPKEPLPQKPMPLTLESLEYKTNNDWSDPSNWP